MIDELLKYAEDNNIYDEEIEDNLKRVEKIYHLLLNFVSLTLAKAWHFR